MKKFAIGAVIAAAVVGTLAGVGAAGPALAAPAIDSPFAVLPAHSEPNNLIVDDLGDVFALTRSGVTKVRPDGVVDTSFSGALPPGSFPKAMAMDARGHLYVASYVASTVWKIDQGSGAVDAAFNARLGTKLAGLGPSALTTDALGNLFVVNEDAARVMKIAPTGDVLDGYPLATGLQWASIALDDSGSLFIGDGAHDAITRIDFDRAGRPAITYDYATLPTGARPVALEMDHRGMLYAANSDNDTVSVIDLARPRGRNVVATFALPASSFPTDLAADQAGDVFVTNAGTGAVSMITPAGAFQSAALQFPDTDLLESVAVAPGGLLYVANSGVDTISRAALGAAIESPSPSSAATVGSFSSSTVTTSGLDPVRVDAVGTLPYGLTLDSATGRLSGSPTTAGTFRFDLVATNALGRSAPQHVTITVAPSPGSTGCWYWHESCGL